MARDTNIVLASRLEAAWSQLKAANGASQNEFWATFDRIEEQVLDGLAGKDRDKAIEALHVFLGRLRTE